VIVADEGLKLMLKTNQDLKTHKKDLQKHQEQSEAPDLLIEATVHKE